jgi:cytochrome b pre-mRNA-processing protein 3
MAGIPRGGQPQQMAVAAASARTGWWRRLRRGLDARAVRRDRVYRLYAAAVAQARLPYLFRELEVPDSRDGRLEMVGLHVMLVMRRLTQEGREGRDLAQGVFDLMFADIDRHLREWGVGDLSVGKHVKRIAQSLMARIAALHPLLEAGDLAAMRSVLARNVYAERPEVAEVSVDRLALYVMRQRRHLFELADDELLRGEVRFAPPAALLGEAPGASS